MRAAILDRHGAAPRLGEIDAPEPDGDRIVIAVEAAGLNPVDLRMASGTFYGGTTPLGGVVGREGVGRTAAGELVYFENPVAPYGAFAERVLVEREDVVELPVEIDPALATCFGIAGLAAWMALDWRARLQEGETVLVLGASGVVGQIAVQAARLLGAGRVVAAARDTGALERTPGAGADAVVKIGDPEKLGDALREACGEGADVVLDPLWGEPVAAALQACRVGARVVQIGESAGALSTLASAPVRGRMLSILGYTNFHAPREVMHAAYRRMVEHAAAGELEVAVERVALGDVAEAWQRQRDSPQRKLVIVP